MNFFAINTFFDDAIRGDWRMTWNMWQKLIELQTDTIVLDNDSGFSDSDVVTAKQAEHGFMNCTIRSKRY